MTCGIRIFTCWLMLVTALSQGVWDTVVDYTIRENIVSVEFRPANNTKYNYTDYSVELWYISEEAPSVDILCDGLEGKCLDGHVAKTRLPTVHETFDNVGSSGYYCVRVSPLVVERGGSCAKGCRAVGSDIFFLKGNNSYINLYDCKNWDVFINLRLWPELRSAFVSYNVNKTTAGCLHYFTIDLWHNVEVKCDGTTGAYFSSQNSVGLRNSLTYHNLENGSYCVRMYPFNSTCRGYCLPQYSQIVSTFSQVTPTFFHPKASDTSWVLFTVLGVILFCTVLFVLRVIHLKRRNKQCRVDDEAFSEEKVHMTTKEVGQKQTIPEEIVLFNIYKSKSEVEKVRLLADFLRSCCGLKACVSDEELHRIVVSPEDWVVEKLSRTCCKIILVESPQFIRLQKNHLNESFLDHVFCNALDFLKAKNSLDYQKIFVVRFGEVPADCVMGAVVPGKRYMLPDHLLELYSDLIDTPITHLLNDMDLVHTWMSQPSYIAFYDSFRRNVI